MQNRALVKAGQPRQNYFNLALVLLSIYKHVKPSDGFRALIEGRVWLRQRCKDVGIYSGYCRNSFSIKVLLNMGYLTNLTPKPKFKDTPNLACGLVFAKIFSKTSFESMTST